MSDEYDYDAGRPAPDPDVEAQPSDVELDAVNRERAQRKDHVGDAD